MFLLPRILVEDMPLEDLDRLILSSAKITPLNPDYPQVQEFLAWAIPARDAMQKLHEEIALDPEAPIHNLTGFHDTLRILASQAGSRFLRRIQQVLE